MGPESGAIGLGGDQADQVELHRRQLGEALNAIRGADSRRLLREVADLSLGRFRVGAQRGAGSALWEAHRDRIRRHRCRAEQGHAPRRAP